MKKVFLSAFIILDLGLIGGSGFVLFTFIRDHKPPQFSGFSAVPNMAPAPHAVTAPVASPTAASSPASPISVPAGAAENGTRKILFTYRNSHAKQVAIRADFTGWKAAPMVKAANGTWTYQASLTPGEYAYIFAVDDKTSKDPANKRTKLIGRTLVSAILVEAKRP